MSLLVNIKAIKAKIAIFLIAAYAINTPATGQNSSKNGTSRPIIQDDSGQTMELPRSARRIITLAPNLTELVYAAGAGPAVVAVSRYSDYPAQAKQLPVVGDAFAINLEAIAKLKPDLVLVWQSGTPQRQREALKRLGQRQGFAVFESEIRSVDDVASTITRIGQLAGSTSKAEQEAQRLQQDWAALAQQYASQTKLRVFYQVWDAPLMTFNGQHMVSQAITACGGVQGFDALSALTPTINREAVASFNPQVIVAGKDQTQALQAWRIFTQIEAVRQNQLQTIDSVLLTRMGPRFAQAARELCEVLDKSRKALR
jgi:iron complex transport system substrate-binding protein